MNLPRLSVLALPVLFVALPARAQDPPHGEDAGAAAAPSSEIVGCIEFVKPGTLRPKLTETFPDRGTSGYATTLEVVVEHGKGETVFPRGFELSSAGDASKALSKAGFVIPEQDAGAGARVSKPRTTSGELATTTLELPLVPLPPDPGRHTLTLPPLPVAVERANGEIATVCTQSHTIVIEDPIAETPDAKPKDNPPPRPQREEWKDLETAAKWVAVGVAAGALLAYALYRWIKRERPVPPPPPPRAPWDVALETLHEVRHAGLLETGRFSEYFDRVNDAVRVYLGARYGFDGLESTTDEIMAAMQKVPHFGLALPEIKLFLQECDLVKFANMTPTIEACRTALDAGEKIVRVTMPHVQPVSQAADASEIRA